MRRSGEDSGREEQLRLTTTCDLSGRGEVMKQAEQVIASARRGIWVAIWPDETRHLRPAFERARRRDVDVTVLLNGERNDVSGTSFWHRNTPHDSVLGHLGYRLLVVVADNTRAIIAGFEGEQARGVRTDHPALALLAVEYVRNNIGAAMTESGDRLPHPDLDTHRASQPGG
jgi:HTH-type transcriptional regulator, sugar sensing transcriptional regulator